MVRLMLFSACVSPYQKQKLVDVMVPRGDEEGGPRTEELSSPSLGLGPRSSFANRALALIRTVP
jgi:hypothetical protein